MANATQSVIGALNKAASNTGAGAAYDTKYATYLKLFSGELFKAYESATIARDTVQRRTLKTVNHYSSSSRDVCKQLTILLVSQSWVQAILQ